jgi:serine/threonine-protein kinase
MRPRAGDVLDGKYRVERVLGEGGMGVVVAAVDMKLDRSVAIKLLLPEYAEDPRWRERFVREARAAAGLSSEHAIRIFQVDKLEGGTPYIVMERLEGEDLQRRLGARGRLGLVEAIDAVLQAAEAIAEAHRLGLVHRDLKPANLFATTKPDGSPLIKVLDFGLAKAATDPAVLTTNSSVFGSPQYMSPEQLRGASQVDARTDIWSLGVTLYELVTGRLPFEASSVAELAAMVMRDPPARPEERLPGIPKGIADALLHCLEKEPAQRFGSIAKLATALEKCRATETDTVAMPFKTVIMPVPPTATASVAAAVVDVSRGAPPDRSRWIGLGATALLVVAAAAGVLGSGRSVEPRTAAAPATAVGSASARRATNADVAGLGATTASSIEPASAPAASAVPAASSTPTPSENASAGRVVPARSAAPAARPLPEEPPAAPPASTTEAPGDTY